MSRVWTPSLWTGPPSGARAYLRRTRGAGGGAFSPADVAGLVAWYKADAIGGLNDGDAVASWADSSAEGNDAAQATAGKRPTYQTNEVNGLPVVRFDGTDDWLEAADDASLDVGDVLTIFVVLVNASGTAVKGLVSKGNGSFGFAINTNRLLMAKSQMANVAPGTAALNTDPHVGAWVKNGATNNVYQDGVDVTGAVTDATLVNTANPLYIGADSGLIPFAGDIAEVLLYNSALGATDRQNVETYLMDKYGLGF